MDFLTADAFFRLVSAFGLPGAILMIWYLSDRNHSSTLKAYREDTLRMHAASQEALGSVKQMYESNVALVKSYDKMASGFQDLVVESTRTLTRVCDLVSHNRQL